MSTPLEIVIATNEPWGTYHSEPLVAEAARQQIVFSQWVPSLEEVPPWTSVRAVTDMDALRRADLVVVNGLCSDHTVAAAETAHAAGVPLCFTELAYLRADPPPVVLPFASVIANAPASQEAIAISAGVGVENVDVLGWPALDHLPERRPEAGLVLALTSVSKPTRTGGNDVGSNALLYAILDELDAAGWRIVVRPHPREDKALWSRWQIDESRSPAVMLARAAIAVGVAGTPALYTAALGVPFLAVVDGNHVPEHLAALVSPVSTPEQSISLAQAPQPLSREAVAHACGPVGGAAQRILAAWREACSAAVHG